ncbi:Permease of the drug/metabolite transporter (DMT) superfamily [Amycolatopsis xylanica]|uniref:Permease of the drug/metabolite transporter (DMT) superfamily n=1 Tax=Amycolatopsis xylanica TaxID=589385 RepID=A0A1H3JZV0_9PSEU|nr:DMT family transporter [Amycolatopsis xylanica]SDY45456.1 Permease of the drug/metabolite transporter (DMT) superfamily [Amycolatopsis xylanica]
MTGNIGIALRFSLLATLWGASFLFIKVGLTGLSPSQVALARLAFGALALALIVVIQRPRLPREPVIWGHFAVMGLLMCVIPFQLFAWAETRISSGLASIFNATTPLLTVLIGGVILRQERLTRGATIGLGFGFAGVLTIVGVWNGLGTADLLGQLACLGAATCYGTSFVYMRHFLGKRHIEPTVLAFGQVTLGTLMMLALSPLVATGPVHLSLPVVLSMAALGMLSTGVAYIWNARIIVAWGATNAAAVTYLTPVVGVVLGVAILHEPLTWNQPAGALLVILGILAAHGRLTLKRRRPDPLVSVQTG